MYLWWPDTPEAFDTDARGGRPGSELDTGKLVRKEYKGKDYARAELCTAFNDPQESVEFWMQVHRVDSQLTPLSEKQTAIFNPSPDHRAVNIILKLNEQPQPTPTPTDFESGVLAFLRRIAEALEAIRDQL